MTSVLLFLNYHVRSIIPSSTLALLSDISCYGDGKGRGCVPFCMHFQPDEPLKQGLSGNARCLS